ncbi:MAG: hypothetical protein K0R00_97 [Herbinix sp.]|jgi:hypothetical protein|nr:hypothetical protein [Herbinix sp.]
MAGAFFTTGRPSLKGVASLLKEMEDKRKEAIHKLATCSLCIVCSKGFSEKDLEDENFHHIVTKRSTDLFAHKHCLVDGQSNK